MIISWNLTDGTVENTYSFIAGSHSRDFEKIKANDSTLYFVKGYDYSNLWKMNTSYELTEIGKFESIEEIAINYNGLYLSYNDTVYALWYS